MMMFTNGETSQRDDTGFAAFATLAGLYGIAVDTGQLRHEVGHDDSASSTDLARLAKRYPALKVRSKTALWKQLSGLPLPALAHGPDGWFIIARATAERALIQRFSYAGVPSAPQQVETTDLDQIWDGTLLLMAARDHLGGLSRSFDVTWFIPQIVRYRALIGEVLAITFGINLLGLASPLFFQSVVDKVLVNNTLDTLAVLAIGFLIVSLWETAFGWLRTRLYAEASQKIDVELGARLFSHLIALPLSFFAARRVGDIAMRVRQLETIREFLTNASLSVLVDPLFTIVFLVVMLFYSIKLFTITVITLPAYVLIAMTVTKPLRARVEEKFERGAANNALLVESIAGIETVKSSAVEPQWRQRWEQQLAAYSATSLRVVNLGNSGSQAIQLVSKLNTAAILYFGARQVIAHEISVGGLIAFNMFAQRVSTPVIRMAQLWQDFQQVRLAVTRLGDVLNQPAEPGIGSRTALPMIRGVIRFEAVSFRYALDGPYTLENIDLQIEAGSTLGIVGSSGSGKSTITKLLQRLYIPQSGRVLIDDVDVAQIDPAWLRRRMGVVLQENLLFSRTIRENIAISDPACSIERVLGAARLAGAHDFISRLPSGYDTVVEERGVNLSGGQRQRIAIARALLHQPQILIFDEATSALDAESEEIIQHNLRDICRGRTVLIIAHRLSAVRQCDRIITLERGKIVEEGTHHELLRLSGRYADLHRRQAGNRHSEEVVAQ